MENQRDMVPIHGKMVRPMRESGLMGIKMAQGYGEDLRVILTLESGKMAKQMDTVSILGSMVIDTKASLKTVSSMEKVLRNLQMGIHTKALMLWGNRMDMENIIGLLVAIIKETFNTAWEVEKGFGREDQETLIGTKVSTKMIRKKVLEHLFGKMDVYTKEISLMIFETVMVKCSGRMAEVIKENG